MPLHRLRSIPELDSQLFGTNFQVNDAEQAKLLCAFDLNDESLPKSRDQWIERLNQIYCQSISLECEFIEVSEDVTVSTTPRPIEQLERSRTSVGGEKIRRNPFVLDDLRTDTTKDRRTNAQMRSE